jgi:hypothetical protein
MDGSFISFQIDCHLFSDISGAITWTVFKWVITFFFSWIKYLGLIEILNVFVWIIVDVISIFKFASQLLTCKVLLQRRQHIWSHSWTTTLPHILRYLLFLLRISLFLHKIIQIKYKVFVFSNCCSSTLFIYFLQLHQLFFEGFASRQGRLNLLLLNFRLTIIIIYTFNSSNRLFSNFIKIKIRNLLLILLLLFLILKPPLLHNLFPQSL